MAVPTYDTEAITIRFTCLPEFSVVGLQQIKFMECALWALNCFAKKRHLLLLWLFSATQLHSSSYTHSSPPMKSSLGSILSCLARKRMQNFYALSSFHYYANGIYLVTCFQQAFASSECVPPKLSKSQSLKPREVTARHCMETRVPQKGKCIVGKRIQNMCSILLGLFLCGRSASEVTWEPQEEKHHM